MENSFLILVDSFDGYQDLWKPFFEIFKLKWDKCTFPIKLVSNHQTFESIETITTGDEVCWSERTLKALEQVDEEYILLLLEDYFIGKTVDNEYIDSIIKFMKRENARYIRFTNIPVSRNNPNKDQIFRLYADEEYAVNLQASIWKKEFLIESLLKYPGNAWDFELGFLKQTINSKHIYLDGCYGLHNDPLDVKNGVLKGKWFPSTIRYCKGNGVDINWQNRGKLPWTKLIKYYVSISIKEKLSYKNRKILKKILKKIGFKFVSDL